MDSRKLFFLVVIVVVLSFVGLGVLYLEVWKIYKLESFDGFMVLICMRYSTVGLMVSMKSCYGDILNPYKVSFLWVCSGVLLILTIYDVLSLEVVKLKEDGNQYMLTSWDGSMCWAMGAVTLRGIPCKVYRV